MTPSLEGGVHSIIPGFDVTLDTNAAGYGWYVDRQLLNPWGAWTVDFADGAATPALSQGERERLVDNSDFLPTSNPKLWVAKAGSAAEGKMDLLSVLLHEVGHALGI